MPDTASPLRRDIARQPDVLAALAARAAAFRDAAAAHLMPGTGGRIVVAGCGDGLFAAEAVRAYAERLGLDWRPMGALDLVLSAGSLRPQDRVIAISMSGNVDRTVEAAQAVEQAGVPILALVNGGGGRLGAIAAAKVSLDLADIAPFLCGTASYTATILALAFIAEGAAGMSAPLAVAPFGAAIATAIARTDAVLANVAPPTGIRILAAGAERGTAAYGAAKFVELTRVPAWSADLEEFAHSQYWSMPASDLVVMIATDPVLARYANDNAQALAELGVTTLAIDTDAAPVPNATLRVTLDAGDPPLMPLVTAVPLQLLAADIARKTGLDPDTRTHLKADETRFRVSRLLTRRSLLGTGQ